MRLRRAVLLAAATTVTAGAMASTAGVVDAHSGIESSVPESGSTVDEPIDEVFIDFGVPISDDVEIAMLDPDEELMPSETERTGETTAVVRFDPIEEEGTYIARYLTTEPDEGHMLAGAISFDYGDVSSGMGLLAWLAIGALCVAILGVGAWFSLRRHRAVTDDPPSDAETPLTGPARL